MQCHTESLEYAVPHGVKEEPLPMRPSFVRATECGSEPGSLLREADCGITPMLMRLIPGKQRGKACVRERESVCVCVFARVRDV